MDFKKINQSNLISTKSVILKNSKSFCYLTVPSIVNYTMLSITSFFFLFFVFFKFLNFENFLKKYLFYNECEFILLF